MKKVICIDDKHEDFLFTCITYGKIYDVIKEDNTLYIIIDNNENKICVPKHRFKVYNREEKLKSIKKFIGKSKKTKKSIISYVMSETGCSERDVVVLLMQERKSSLKYDIIRMVYYY